MAKDNAERTVRVGDLVGAGEIGSRLGVQAKTVLAWFYRFPDFPRPLTRLGVGYIWTWPEVEAWAIEHGRSS